MPLDTDNGTGRREDLHNRYHQRSQQTDAGADDAEIVGERGPVRLRGCAGAIDDADVAENHGRR